MTIEAHQLETWIGTDVLDSSAEKLGKIDDVYFRGDEPVAIRIRSGLVGRKHHLAALRGATVSRESLQLNATADTLTATGGGDLGAEQLASLAVSDDRLNGMQPGDLEGWNARDERLQAQAAAQAKADDLDAEAQRHGAEEQAATNRARHADHQADEARQAREDAEARAQQARDEAEQPI